MGAPWTDLDQVIVMAAPGDVVLLNGLQFPPFTLTKGLTLIGPGTIRPFTFFAVDQVSTLTIPSGQQAHFAAVDFAPHPAILAVTHRVVANGRVTFEDCSFGAGAPNNLIVSGTILLHHCLVHGSTINSGSVQVGGMRVQGGVCCITNSTLVGASAVFSGGYATYIVPPSPALVVQAGIVLLSTSNLFGGAGLAHPMFGAPLPGAPAVVVTNGTTSVSDCSLRGGPSPNMFAGAAALVGNANTFHGRTTLVGGGGATTGAPSLGPVQHLPQIVGMAIGQRFRLGLATPLTAIAGSSQPLGMFAGFDPTPTTHPAVIGPILGSLAQLVPLLLTTPSPGLQVVHTISVPNQAFLLGVGLHAQACQLDGNVVRMSAGIGGVVH